MGKNLAGKTASIIAVLVIFIYGIFFGWNGPKLGSLKSLLADNIRLGLDLKGGTHLVLQVHVDEAVTSATDRDVARLKSALQDAGITASVGKTDLAHPETIVVSGIPPAKGGNVAHGPERHLARECRQSREQHRADGRAEPDRAAARGNHGRGPGGLPRPQPAAAARA